MARKKKIIILSAVLTCIVGIAAISLMNRTDKKADIQKIAGRWLRTDGSYVLEIKKIHDTGSVDAAYYNPSPIHISKSEIRQEGIFVELQDAGYPGSAYTLNYDPKKDILAGIYYHAPSRRNFSVFFRRY